MHRKITRSAVCSNMLDMEKFKNSTNNTDRAWIRYGRWNKEHSCVLWEKPLDPVKIRWYNEQEGGPGFGSKKSELGSYSLWIAFDPSNYSFWKSVEHASLPETRVDGELCCKVLRFDL